MNHELITDIKGWGIALIVWGIISLIASGFLDSQWGIITIIIGAMCLFNQDKKMYLLIGTSLLVVGIMNIIWLLFSDVSGSNYAWPIIGIIQIVLGITQFKKYFSVKSNGTENQKKKEGGSRWGTIITIFVFIMLFGMYQESKQQTYVPQQIQQRYVPPALTPQPVSTTDNIGIEYSSKFYPFVDQTTSRTITITIDATQIVQVYAVPSESDWNKMSSHQDYNKYDCYIGATKGKTSCAVTSGGIVVWKPGNYEVNYTLTMVEVTP